MLNIDGSMGEGGGSVLRLALALASVKGEPIRIYNIRANRPKPGLANQHLAAVRALRELTDAETEGVDIGSKEVLFRPRGLDGGDIRADIGTAGSTTLILQAVMIPAAFAKDPVELKITGGTDNPFAPPVDYLINVTLPMLRKLGYRGEVECLRRGHYPKGGGEIRAEIKPTREFDPLSLSDRGDVVSLSGRSHCVRLPGHIAKRQAESAVEELEEAGYSAEIETEFYSKSEDPHLSPGSGIVLWARTENDAILGSSSLGKKGKPAEKVGEEAAESLLRQLRTGRAVDRHLTDQIVPYLALASGESKITSTELTSHTLTNVRLVEKVLGSEVSVCGDKGESGEIIVRGVEI